MEKKTNQTLNTAEVEDHAIMCLWKEIRDLYERYKPVIWICFILLIAAYGYEISNYTLSIDESPFVKGSVEYAKGWLYDKRFTITLLELLFMRMRNYPPYFATFLCIVLWLFSGLLWSVLLLRWTGEKRPSAFAIFSFLGIYICVPFVMTEWVIFNTYNIEVSLGMIMVTVSLWFMDSANECQKPSRKAGAFVLLVLSMGIYQNFITVYIAGVLIKAYFRLWDERLEWNAKNERICVLQQGVFSLAAAITYVMIADLILEFMPPRETLYIDNYMGWGQIAGGSLGEKIVSVIDALRRSIRSVPNIVSGYKDTGSSYYVCALLAAFLVMVIGAVRLKGKKKLCGILFLLLIQCAPFLLWIAILAPGGPLPRTLQSLIVVMALSWFLLLWSLSNGGHQIRWLNRIAALLTVIVVLGQVQHTARIFYSANLTYRRDAALLNEVMARVGEETGENPYNMTRPIYLISGCNFPENGTGLKGDRVGGSFWTDYRNRLGTLGIELGYNQWVYGIMPDSEEVAAYRETLEPWPADGCMVVEENRVVIRMD